MNIHLTEAQLIWLAETFAAADINTKIEIDPESTLEQQLVEMGDWKRRVR